MTEYLNLSPTLYIYYDRMKITKEDIGRKFMDMSDGENMKGRIIAIDIDGRAIVDYEDLSDEVFLCNADNIVFEGHEATIQTITIDGKSFRLVPLSPD